MKSFWQDVRYGIRVLAKSPGITLIALLTLAIGIGANTAMFGVVNAVLLRPLAYNEPSRIVTISTLWQKSGAHGQVSAPDYHDWHDQASPFGSMAYYQDDDCATVAQQRAEYSHCAQVTPEFFRVFLLQPAAGHFFSDEERKSGAVVISYAYWQHRFGSDANVIGQSIRLFDRSLSIAGVAPQGFRFPANTDLWIPANSIIPETESRSGHNYRVIARMKPGISVGEAQAQMTAIASRLAQQYPASDAGKSAVVIPMRDDLVSNVRLTLYLLLGAVGMVLLIACANIANLLLAKAAGRSREFAIRSAMGASRGRIVRQMLAESGLLALAAGALGIAIAVGATALLVRLAPPDIPRLNEIGIDLRVLAFTFGAAAISTMIFGIAPALHATRIDLNESLQQSGTRNVSSRSTHRLLGALVVAEVALSVVLMAGAGLLLHSFDALLNVQMGFRAEQILVMQSDVPASDEQSSRRAAQLYKTLLAQAAATPGVVSVSATRDLPGQSSSNGIYWIDRLTPQEQWSMSGPQAILSVVAPGFFRTMDIPAGPGRDFGEQDTFDAPFVALINEALARQAFPNQDPIGHQIYCGLDSLKAMTIVGVVGNVRQSGPAVQPLPEIYMPYEQHPRPSTSLSLLIRTAAAPGALEESLQRKLREISPDVPSKFTTMEAQLSNSVAAPRFRALLVTLFAALALILAMAGIYGVMAYSVAERTREIGIRMALGAQTSGVMRLVLAQGMKHVGFGLVLGFAGALAVTRLMASLLFGVKPADPVAFTGAFMALLCVALVANYVPARRATRVDPMVALRHD
ncbi:MAG: ABC transporter permease [Candidatus Acidiferrales bacterium]